MQIQRADTDKNYKVGFMDPMVVNQDQIRDQPEKTFDAIYRYLSEQNYKEIILLPYNFK